MTRMDDEPTLMDYEPDERDRAGPPAILPIPLDPAMPATAGFVEMDLAWVLDGMFGEAHGDADQDDATSRPSLLKSPSLHLSADDLREIDCLLRVRPEPAAGPPQPPPRPRRPAPAASPPPTAAPAIVFVPCGRNGFRAVLVGAADEPPALADEPAVVTVAATRARPRGASASPTTVMAVSTLRPRPNAKKCGTPRRKREKRVVHSRRQEIAKARPRRGGRFVKTSTTRWLSVAELQELAA